MRLLLIILVSSIANISLGDWAVQGAAYSCNNDTRNSVNYFGLAHVQEASNGGIPPRKGYEGISPGKHQINCEVGDNTVHAEVTVFEPSTRMCNGAGSVRLNSLKINNDEMILNMYIGESGCGPGKFITEIIIAELNKKTIVKSCSANNYDPIIGYHNLKCEEHYYEKYDSRDDPTGYYYND